MKTTKAHAIRAMFSFMKPYAVPFIFGMSLYGTQSFCTSFLISLMLSRLTQAMLSGDKSRVLQTGVIFTGLYLIYFILLGLCVYQYVKQSERIRAAVKDRLFRSFIRTSVEDVTHSGEGIASMNTDADTATNLYSNNLAPFISSITAVFFSAIVVFMVDYRLGIVSLLIGFIAFILQFRFSKPLSKIAGNRLEANSKTVRSFSNMLSGAAILRVFNLQNKMMISFDTDNDRLLKLSFKEAVIAMWQNLFSTVQGWLTLAGIFGIGGWLVATGRLELAALMLVPNMCMALCSGMTELGGAWAGLQAPLAAAAKVIGRIELGERMGLHSERKSMGEWNGDAALHIQSLSFAYQNSEKDTLCHISLRIPHNHMVAFVGASGSGKSTLLRALIGMYEREHLPIFLGNIAYDRTELREWRGCFAYVDQSCKLFDMSIADNIALGRPGAVREEVIQAAKLALADEFITELPQGYDTACGEKGAALSGGQKQRIAIARALVRKAPILVFDEATSALDAESERQFMQTIAHLRGSHTILITTHNLQHIEDADQIVVLKDGRLAETGTHNELLGLSGEYSRLLLNG